MNIVYILNTEVINMDVQIRDRISNLEGKIWCWAIIYYRLGDSIVTDKQYDLTSKELQRLSQEHPEEFAASKHYDVFKEFSWVSGYDLPLYDVDMTNTAEFVLAVSKLGMEGYKDKMGRDPIKITRGGKSRK